MEKEIDKLQAMYSASMVLQNDLAAKLTKIESTPLNVDKVTFSGKQLTVIVGTCIALAGGMWQLHVGIDKTVEKVEGLQIAIQNNAKLQDERNETTRQALDQVRANLEMRRVEIQNLSNFIQQNVVVRQGAK